MSKKFVGCHIEPAKHAMKLFEYCQKGDTRVEGPLVHGMPPAKRNEKGDVKKQNELLM